MIRTFDAQHLDDEDKVICYENFRPSEWVNVITRFSPEEHAELTAHMTDTAKANILLQIIGTHTEMEQSRDFKLLAVELAEVLGPDHAQTLYRLAVLTTKLA